MHPLEALKKNPFVLAPMAGITDHAFRTFMKKLDVGIVVTELISANGIEYKSQRTMDLMSFDETQHPIGIQLFGEDPEILGRAAQVAEAEGCDFVDLNFGCPVPKVVKKGAGSAMLKDLDNLQKVLSTVKKSIKIPLTIKIRTGWDANTRNAVEVCNIAYNEGIEWVAIHGRTRAQNYTGLADWDFIADVKSQVKVPIIGNGDILTARQAVLRLEQSGCDGVMIGRGALKNPYIFRDALHLWQGKSAEELGQHDFAQVYRDLKDCVVAHCHENITQIQLRKFAAWFSTGYAGASNFRKNIFQSKSIDETIQLAEEFFQTISLAEQEDTSGEAFLMGGHG